MSCEYCRGKPIITECRKHVIGSGKILTWENEGGDIIYGSQDDGFPINFCPMCGTPLTEPEPLTVEQLLEMRRAKPDKGYDPVWIKTISDGKVSCVIANKLFRTDYRYKTPKTWADAHRVNLPLDEYGKTWAAYDRKPKEGLF